MRLISRKTGMTRSNFLVSGRKGNSAVEMMNVVNTDVGAQPFAKRTAVQYEKLPCKERHHADPSSDRLPSGVVSIGCLRT